MEKRKSASSPVFARNFGFENFVEFDWILCGTTVENFFVSKDRCKIPGGKDHSTIKHGIEKIENELKADETLSNTINIIKKKINPA